VDWGIWESACSNWFLSSSKLIASSHRVVVASAFLPIVPIVPIQLMVQNLLYDTAQLALPWDRVDGDYVQAPRRWQSGGLIRFMLIFGSLSSVVDLATFAVLWRVFDLGGKPTMFQTGWFVEGLLTQLLVVLVLRARTMPWRGARPARAVVLAAITAAAIGSLLPLTPLGTGLGMDAAPARYLVWLVVVMVAYGSAAHLVKKQYLRHHQAWL
jgi:Mg2+-importing ATPase